MEKTKNVIGSKILGLIFCGLLVAFDQLTKYWAILYLKGKSSIPIISNVFSLHYLENRGAAFGVFQNQKYMFIIITSIAIVLFLLLYWNFPREKKFAPLRILGIFIIAGAFGNLIDRIRLDYVIDFFYFELIDFPIFNMADIYVTVSVFCLLFLLLLYYKEEDLEKLSIKKLFKKK